MTLGIMEYIISKSSNIKLGLKISYISFNVAIISNIIICGFFVIINNNNDIIDP